MTNGGVLFLCVFTGVWVLVGLVFVCVGAGLLRALAKRRARCGCTAQGLVAELRPSGAQVLPVARYTVYGTEYEVAGQRPYYVSPLAAGDAVEVCYNGDNPADAFLPGHSPARLLGRIFLAAGIGWIALGLIIGIPISLFAF